MSHFDEKYTLDVFQQLLAVDSTTVRWDLNRPSRTRAACWRIWAEQVIRW